MLAVQRPRMGSSQPPDTNLPFGYSYDGSHDFFFDPPPEPAPGAPLLSDNDSKMISSFFDDMTADHYNVPSFGEGLNYSDAWLQLPPQFMGSATSYGQGGSASASASLPSPGNELLHQDYVDFSSMGGTGMGSNGMGSNGMGTGMSPGMMAPPPPPQAAASAPPRPMLDTHHSAEVLAAASVLQNGASPRTPMATAFAPRDVPTGHLRHQALEDFRRSEPTHNYPHATEFAEEQHANAFADLVFGVPPAQRQPGPGSQPGQPPVEMRWGSDMRFGSNFVPDSSRETLDAISKDQLRYIECLEPSQSASNTRPPSPNGDARPRAPTRQAQETSQANESAEGPPRKRRKSRNTRDDTEDEENTREPTAKVAKKRKPKADAAAAAAAAAATGAPAAAESETTGRRRKSGAVAKPPRENLTDAQKRENHIRSEQKRRTVIKEGFDDLCDLVPGLRGGGFSKSTMLTMAADWLEDTLKGNEQLAAQLDALEGKS